MPQLPKCYSAFQMSIGNTNLCIISDLCEQHSSSVGFICDHLE